MSHLATPPVPPGWGEALAHWGLALRSAGRPATTIATRTENVRRFARHGGVDDPWAVTADDLIAWTGAQQWAAETRRGIRNSLLAFYRWGVAAGHLDSSPAEALPRVKPTPPSPRPTPPSVYAAALAVADARTRLILRLAAEAGLRRAEIAQIHEDDLIEDLAGWSLHVRGKGNRRRLVPLPRALAGEIRTTITGWLFPGDDHGHLSPRYVGKLATRALPGEWTLHSLRHQFATRAYALERDVFTVQELLGHASPATTRAYVQVPDDARRRHVDALAAGPLEGAGADSISA